MTRADKVVACPLADLLAGIAQVPAGLEVSDLTVASGEVRPGGAFLACAGRTTHGLAHADEAIERGARVILWEPVAELRVPEFPEGIFALPVPHLRAQLGVLADRYFGAPSASMALVGITGTNGKTTTAWLAAQALAACGRRASYSGTLGYGAPGDLRASSHTTPDAVTVHRQLAAQRDAGADCVAMEVSSHALDQGRVAGVRFHTAVFTNLTRDHLDYHGTMAAYGAAKAALFDWPTLAARVINVDDPFGVALANSHRDARGRLVTVSRRDRATLRAVAMRAAARGLELDLESEWGSGTIATRLVGEFNADNALAVLGVLLAADVPFEAARRAIGACTAPPGRMESFGGEAGAPLAIVDYAHTPDALEKALAAARAHCRGRLSVVFGCGGDRDPGKRPLMGAIASRGADRLWITDDNPRTEAAALITAAIAAGVEAGTDFHIEHDRAAAIRAALDSAQGGDAVLIAGKGHEDYQIIGHERRAFSDQAVVRAALAARGLRGVQGVGT
ncbi:MAG: UDP-N-acetylmuramoyl-L-alanyl-D-glutamate--2,6-diaminopimelate ligase [Steroidobacteraceae bacterium]|nr:UDP-N-acetylmuramoyl-L-alanyl-D-glutamate--2,6-diaminopimelate ligase [Steroidobacteraceae bacterium]